MWVESSNLHACMRALMAISGKAVPDKKYGYPRFISWEEGIVDYLVNEINESDED